MDRRRTAGAAWVVPRPSDTRDPHVSPHGHRGRPPLPTRPSSTAHLIDFFAGDRAMIVTGAPLAIDGSYD